MKSTSIDTGTIVCLGIINAVRPVPSLRVSLIGKGAQSHRCFLTKHQTADGHKMQMQNQKSARVEGEQRIHPDFLYRLCIR
jgi:hypothetical protein